MTTSLGSHGLDRSEASFPREAVQLIAFSCEKRRLRAGEALFFPGETADSGYFVHSGAITLLEDRGEPKSERHAIGAEAPPLARPRSTLRPHDGSAPMRLKLRGA